MKKLSSSLLVVLGTASLLTGLAGCGGKLTAPPSPPPPTGEVSATATVPNIMARAVSSPNYKVQGKVTNTKSSDTTFSCKSESVNIAMIDGASCLVTPSNANSGMATFDVVPTADNSKKASVTSQVGAWALLDSSADLQFIDVDGKGSLITVFDHAALLHHNNGCYHSSVQHDLLTLVCVNFWSNGPSVFNIYQTDGTGGGTKLLRSLDMSLAEYGGLNQVLFPSWSVDGTKILFVSSDAGSVRSVRIVDADGTKPPIDLFDEAPSTIGMEPPHFTPNGKSITFYNVADGTLWIMGVDGSNPHQLLSVPSLSAFYTKDMSTMYYADATAVYVSGSPDPLFSGLSLLGISPDEKSLLLVDYAAGQTYVGSVNGGTPTKIGTGSWGSW